MLYKWWGGKTKTGHHPFATASGKYDCQAQIMKFKLDEEPPWHNSALKVLHINTCMNKRPVGLSSFVNCPPVVASFLTQRQLSINAGWQHMGRVPHPNYVDPKCCVVTVCHQVHFMYWEHLGHFQRAISHLKWHKIVCMRYLACAFSQMKSTDMFSMYLQSGVPRHFIWWFIAGWT